MTAPAATPRVAVVTGGASGIGLASSKAFVEAQGGTIWVDRSTAKGAAFHFTVPVGDG